MRCARLVGFVLLITMVNSSDVQAKVYTVGRLGDSMAGYNVRGTLRYCIAQANANPGPDSIKFIVNGTIYLTSALPVIEEDLEITGPGSTQLILDGAGKYRVLQIDPGAKVIISAFTIAHGYADINLSIGPGLGGGIINLGGDLLMDSIILDSNGAFISGGGLFNADAYDENYNLYTAKATLNHCQIINNHAGANTDEGGTSVNMGGGISSDSGDMNIRYTTIQGNYINVDGGARSGSADRNIHVYAKGGGIFIDAAYVVIEHSLIADNYVRTTNFSNDVNHSEGGGIFNIGDVRIQNSTISGNMAQAVKTGSASGGGIEGFVFQLSHSTIANNQAYGHNAAKGGGMSMGIYQMHHSIVANNNVSCAQSPAYGPDINGVITESTYNLIGDTKDADGFSSTDLLNIDPGLCTLSDNGGPTLSMALAPCYTGDPSSPARDAGNPNISEAPEWDQRGNGFPRISGLAIDIGALEMQ
ncbi:MAG: hypothetical protein HJJLKODD_02219 [Phycisphaerae bacterium]|nr:hypothetical protein [Phycisphaerae bacterium]